MMRGGQHSTPPSTYKIPNRFTIHEIPGGNWGWHIGFTEEAEGTHGLWLRSAPFLDDARGEYELCAPGIRTGALKGIPGD
jgi:hypothetical protein